VLVVSCC